MYCMSVCGHNYLHNISFFLFSLFSTKVLDHLSKEINEKKLSQICTIQICHNITHMQKSKRERIIPPKKTATTTLCVASKRNFLIIFIPGTGLDCRE